MWAEEMTNLDALKVMHRIRHKLLNIEQALDLADLKEKHVAVDPTIAALIAKFDAATDKIAARIQKLIDAGGLNADSTAALQSEVDKLNLLGEDPANPVPPAVA
jgi:hypothetical protein